MQTGFLATY